jgi:hypothetical protein
MYTKKNKTLARKLRLGKKTVIMLSQSATTGIAAGFKTSGYNTCPWSQEPQCTR